MSSLHERTLIRTLHLVLSIPIIGFIYGPVAQIPPAAFFTRFVAVPLVTGSGIWMWQKPRLTRWLRQHRRKQSDWWEATRRLIHADFFTVANAATINYSEGLFVGYRGYEKNRVQPQYPFGHGLSYTEFKYSDLDITPGVLFSPWFPFYEDRIQVSFRITNIGSRRALRGSIEPTGRAAHQRAQGFQKGLSCARRIQEGNDRLGSESLSSTTSGIRHS
jgi:hypothetical protein